MKKLLCIAVAVMVIFAAGCSTLVEKEEIMELPANAIPEPVTYISEYTLRTSLYFTDKESGRLTAEARAMRLDGDDRPLYAVIEALLRGPESAALEHVGMGYALKDIEMSEEVANVYFAVNGQDTERQRFILSLCVANTLSDHYGVEYVNTFFNGEALSIGGMPCGALTAATGSASVIYGEYAARLSAEETEYEVDAAIYFLAADGVHIIPEPRVLSFSGTAVSAEDYVKRVIYEMAAGPDVKYYLSSPINAEVDCDNIEIRYLEDGRMYIHTDEQLFSDKADTQEEQISAISALYKTVKTFVPALKGLYVVSGDVRGYSDYTRAEGLMGAKIKLLFPSAAENELVREERIVSADKAASPGNYLFELMKGPEKRGTANVFPNGVDEADILDVYMCGSVAVVNVSQNFIDEAGALDAETETLLYYSIVNTLTQTDNVSSVQFLVEGKQLLETGGEIDIYLPLLPNMGLGS